MIKPVVLHVLFLQYTQNFKAQWMSQYNVRKLSYDALLIECASEQPSIHFLKLKSHVNVSVKVSPYTTLIFCKGVISSPDLTSAT